MKAWTPDVLAPPRTHDGRLPLTTARAAGQSCRATSGDVVQGTKQSWTLLKGNGPPRIRLQQYFFVNNPGQGPPRSPELNAIR